jgi:hypothetical protein
MSEPFADRRVDAVEAKVLQIGPDEIDVRAARLLAVPGLDARPARLSRRRGRAAAYEVREWATPRLLSAWVRTVGTWPPRARARSPNAIASASRPARACSCDWLLNSMASSASWPVPARTVIASSPAAIAPVTSPCHQAIRESQRSDVARREGIPARGPGTARSRACRATWACVERSCSTRRRSAARARQACAVGVRAAWSRTSAEVVDGLSVRPGGDRPVGQRAARTRARTSRRPAPAAWWTIRETSAPRSSNASEDALVCVACAVRRASRRPRRAGSARGGTSRGAGSTCENAGLLGGSQRRDAAGHEGVDEPPLDRRGHHGERLDGRPDHGVEMEQARLDRVGRW